MIMKYCTDTIEPVTAHVSPGGRSARGRRGFLSAQARDGLTLLELVTTWRRRLRQRDDLMKLDERLLKDIGVSRGDAEAEWRRPFWRP
jgi:uncharacterized protein YjiS (DUF1127 family)